MKASPCRLITALALLLLLMMLSSTDSKYLWILEGRRTNPVAEKAVKEFREQKLSSKEILLNRDQYTSNDLNLDDASLSEQQVSLRLQNHPHSARSKMKKGVPAKASLIWPGALVFLKKDLSKLKGREEYIVVSLDKENPDYCLIKKAVRQLRVENYKVKLTEISLIPNQKPPRVKDCEIDSLDIDKPLTESSAIDKPPAVNYETEDATFPGSTRSKTEVTDPCKHNLRRKPRKNYRELNEGIHNIINSAYSKIDPPKYAWTPLMMIVMIMMKYLMHQ